MQRYIISHTSMRGIAALLVVAYHLQFGAGYLLPIEAATPFFKVGYLWVDLFFILSGFVISYSARLDERAPYDRAQVKSFLVTRFARIYPLHIVTLVTFAAVAVGQYAVLRAAHKPADAEIFSPTALLNLVEQAFLLNAWGLTGRVGWNIPSWSISAEWVAYMCFPLLAAAVALRRGPALFGLGLGALAFYAWIGLTTRDLDIVQRVALLRCLAGFGLGMILYAVRDRFEAMGARTLGLLQFAGLAIALSTMCLGLNDVFAIPGFFLLVAATWPDRGWLAAPLKSSPLHWLGEISYSVYLNHLWILGIWMFVTTHSLNHLPLSPMLVRLIELAGGYALVLAVSHVTYHHVEQPARRMIVDAYRRRQTVRATSALQAENPLT